MSTVRRNNEFAQDSSSNTSLGERTSDLRVESIVKDNIRLLDLLEEIKDMDRVNDVVWSEIVRVVGRKNPFHLQ